MRKDIENFLTNFHSTSFVVTVTVCGPFLEGISAGCLRSEGIKVETSDSHILAESGQTFILSRPEYPTRAIVDLEYNRILLIVSSR